MAETPRDEDQVRVSEERARLMVEAVRDYAIFSLDAEGFVRSWNAGAAALKGYTSAEIIGRHFSTFYTEAERRSGHPADELRVAKAVGRYEEEGWRVRKDGSQFWANVVITAIFDATGQHLGFTKVTRDLTERHEADERLRESEERFRLLVASVRDYAIFMLDPQGRIVTWNSGAKQIKHYDAEEVLGKHFSLFYPHADVAIGKPDRELEIAIAEGRYEEEGWRLRKGGEPFWANVVITAIYGADDQLRGFAKVTRDLTERRRAEQEMRAAERVAIEERTRTLEARIAVQQRDEFLSIAAHELRTPISALQLKVQGVARAMRKASVGSGFAAPKLADRLDAASGQVQRLTELVDRLLDVSRIVGGRLALKAEEFDLTDLVSQVVDDFGRLAREAGSTLTFEGAAAVIGQWDRARVEQIAVNLLSNAVKYGAGKPIEVRVEATEAGARLIVRDQGIGIDPDDVERIFARFERAAPARHFAGLGLGLYITRNIVEAHGGTIDVQTHAGQGSVFTIELPRRAPPSAAIAGALSELRG